MRFSLLNILAYSLLLSGGIFALLQKPIHAQQRDPGSVQEGREIIQEQNEARTRAVLRCCKCVKRTEEFCVPLTGVVSCDAYRGAADFSLLSDIQRNALVDFQCSDLERAACEATGGSLTAIPAPTSGTRPPTTTPAPSASSPASSCRRTFQSFGEAVGTLNPNLRGAEQVNQNATFTSITPELGVQIPGLVFSPAVREGGIVRVPFIAQYIAAIERYAISLAAVAAIVMMVYGGMLYLLGSAVQDVATGKQIMIDALIGLLVTLGSFVILSTINPNTLDLQELKLGYIDPIHWGENIGAFPSAQAGTTPCRCSPSPTEVNEARVLGVPCFFQWGGTWGAQAYGPSLLLPGESVPSCVASAVGKPACSGHEQNSSCVGTIGQGGCGAASLATVLGFYGATTKEGFPVTPLEAARYLVRSCQRVINSGTHGICSSSFSTEFPGFSCSSDLGVPTHSAAGVQKIAEELRAGHPIIFHCDTCRVRNANGQEILGTGGGHFMVLTGVSEDGRVFSVHDVGWGPPRGAVAVRAEDIENTFHEFDAPDGEGVSRHWRGNINVIAVIKPTTPNRTPAPGMCRGRTRRNAENGSDKIIRIPFTYCPGGACDGVRYQAEQASIIMDSSFLKLRGVRIRAFLYIHGLNTSHTQGAQAGYIRKWKNILTRYSSHPGRPAIAVIAPHSLSGDAGSFFTGLNGPEVLRAAQSKLEQEFSSHGGTFTIQDIAISAHSSGVCDGHFARASNATYPVPRRGTVAFDGCTSGFARCSGGGGSLCVHHENEAMIINPDQSVAEPTHSLGRGATNSLVSTYGLSPVGCPSYAQGKPGVGRCFSRTFGSPNNGWMLFETDIGHSASVETVGEFALRAFYGE